MLGMVDSILTIAPLIRITHWGRVTHICVGNLTIIGPDNGLSPGRRQAIIWTNAGILLIGPWGTNFSEILIDIRTFSFNKIHLKMSSAKWRPFCLGLNVIMATRHLLDAGHRPLQAICRGLNPYIQQSLSQIPQPPWSLSNLPIASPGSPRICAMGFYLGEVAGCTFSKCSWF